MPILDSGIRRSLFDTRTYKMLNRKIFSCEGQTIHLPCFRAGRGRNLRGFIVNEFNLREFNPWVGSARPLGRWRIGIKHGVYSQNERASRVLACALYMSLYSAIYVALYSALYRDISIY